MSRYNLIELSALISDELESGFLRYVLRNEFTTFILRTYFVLFFCTSPLLFFYDMDMNPPREFSFMHNLWIACDSLNNILNISALQLYLLQHYDHLMISRYHPSESILHRCSTFLNTPCKKLQQQWHSNRRTEKQSSNPREEELSRYKRRGCSRCNHVPCVSEERFNKARSRGEEKVEEFVSVKRVRGRRKQ